MSKRIAYPLLALALILALSACGVTGQTVFIRPMAKVTGSNVGQGKTVAVRVVDSRADKVIGYRDTDFGKNAPIRAEGDLGEALLNSVTRALGELGFNPSSYREGSPRVLTIEIRSLAYEAVKETMSTKSRVRTVLKAHATNGGGTFDGNYPVETSKEDVLRPGEAENAKYINDALSEALTVMLADQELVNFLGRDSARGRTIVE